VNGKKKQHDSKFKARVALEAIKGEKTIAEISSMYGVHSTQITRWKKKALEGLVDIFSNNQEKVAKETDRVQDELYKQIGQLKVELDWLKKKSGLLY
jgi:transposase